MSRTSRAQSSGANYHKKFIKELTKYSQTDTPLQEWKYAGGNTGRHANWFKNLYPNQVFLSGADRCICTHPIIENCYIQNRETNRILIIGSCCIKRFIPEEAQGRTCSICDEPHQNRNDPWCYLCRGGILNFGRHRGMSYRWILEREPDYGRYLLASNSTSRNVKYLCRWLKEKGLTEAPPVRSRSWTTPSRERGINRTQYRQRSIRRSNSSPFKRTRTQTRNRSYKRTIVRGVLGCGKHKHKTYTWIKNNDKDYCQWVMSIESPSAEMMRFKTWLMLRGFNSDV